VFTGCPGLDFRTEVARCNRHCGGAGVRGSDVTAAANYVIGVLDPAGARLLRPDRLDDDLPQQRVRPHRASRGISRSSSSPVQGYDGNYEGNLGTTDGGCVDNPFRWCDNLNNNDPKVLTFRSEAFALTTVRMAFDKNIAAGIQPQAQRTAAKLNCAAVSAGHGRFASR
jgi:hypothetical protein